jgi:hypothetical protein
MDEQQITISDLDALKNLINVACSRGAFRADEMTQIGTLYDKLDTFLTVTVTVAQAEAQAATEATQTGE